VLIIFNFKNYYYYYYYYYTTSKIKLQGGRISSQGGRSPTLLTFCEAINHHDSWTTDKTRPFLVIFLAKMRG